VADGTDAAHRFAAAFGVSLVVLKAVDALDVIGVLAALAATGSMSAGTVLTKRWGRPDGVGPLALTAWQLTAGGLLIAPLALLAEGAPPALDGGAAGGYLYLALANTAVAYWLWFRGIGRLTATQVTFLGPLSPLTAAIVGWVALGEALTPVQLAGMAVAFGATVLGQLTPSGDRRRTPTPGPLRTAPFTGPEDNDGKDPTGLAVGREHEDPTGLAVGRERR
jgi:probable blue pigment (indigoidine) exporter